MQRLSFLKNWRQSRVIVAVGVAALILWRVGTASAEYQPWNNGGPVKRPYIFTQQNNVEGRPDAVGRTQMVRLGYPLQVQLPGNPAVWSFAAEDSKLVEPRGRTMVYSPNRVDGAESIFVFDFALSEDAKAGDEGMIVLTTAKLPKSLGRVMPLGVFAVKFEVIDPK